MVNHAKQLTEKEILFRKFNEKLRMLDKSIGNDIICPQCWRKYSIKSLKSELSTEHVAPLSTAKLIGENTYTTLTCKNCNNTYGSEYHSQLKKFLIFQLHQAGKYEKPIKGHITIPSADILPLKSNIVFTQNSTAIKVAGVPKANAPFVTQSHLSLWNKMSDNSEGGWSFNITFNYEFVPSIAWVAFLQVAYLMAYIQTNCYYASSKVGAELRKIINDRKAKEIGPCIILPSIIGIGGKPWIARINEPTQLKCLWVKVAGNIVILPLIEDNNMSCYREWQKISEQTQFGLKPPEMHMKMTFSSQEDLLAAQQCVTLTP
jgi:hypothetical protein